MSRAGFSEIRQPFSLGVALSYSPLLQQYHVLDKSPKGGHQCFSSMRTLCPVAFSTVHSPAQEHRAVRIIIIVMMMATIQIASVAGSCPFRVCLATLLNVMSGL